MSVVGVGVDGELRLPALDLVTVFFKCFCRFIFSPIHFFTKCKLFCGFSCTGSLPEFCPQPFLAAVLCRHVSVSLREVWGEVCVRHWMGTREAK